MKDEGSLVDRVGRTRVSDLDLAAFLLCGGAQLIEIVETPDPARRDFVLAASDGVLERSIGLFMSGRAKVEPRHFAHARRALQRALRAG